MPRMFIHVGAVFLIVAAGAERAGAQSDPASCAPFVLTGTVLECTASGSPRGQLGTGTFIAGSTAVGETLALALGVEVATAPVGSSSGGFTYTFNAERREWTRTARTFGPAFSERALTIGRKKLSAGFNYLPRRYDRVDGIALDQIVPFQFRGGSLAVSASTLQLKVSTDTVAAFAHYGVLDTLDVGVLVPYVHIAVEGTSRIFGQADEELQRVNLDASASGVGDVAIFGKYRFWRTATNANAPGRDAGLAVALTARLPTGDENKLLGLGTGRLLVSLVGSAATGRFSPHVNVGYEFWGSSVATPQDFQGSTLLSVKDQVQYSAGLEYEQNARLTLVLDVLGRYQRGGGQVGYQEFRFPANRANVPGAEALVAIPGGYNAVLIAPGAKWNFYRAALLTVNVLISATDGGLTDRVTPVIGLDLGL